ncbi:MAG: HAD family hydrolase [Armatimonadota bacterium]
MDRGALFDLDGVIVDSSQFHYESWVKLGEEVGFVMTPEFFRKTFGQRNDLIIKQLVPNATDEQIVKWGARKEELYREVARGRLVPLRGAMELIRGLKELGFKLAIASSTPRVNIAFAIEQLNMGELFDNFVGAEDVKRGKPDPEVFLTAAQKVGVPPERCVVFEDAIAGVIAAKSGGMKCVAVTTTNPKGALVEAGADLVVDSLVEITPQQVIALLEEEKQ